VGLLRQGGDHAPHLNRLGRVEAELQRVLVALRSAAATFKSDRLLGAPERRRRGSQVARPEEPFEIVQPASVSLPRREVPKAQSSRKLRFRGQKGLDFGLEESVYVLAGGQGILRPRTSSPGHLADAGLASVRGDGFGLW
jgi:hypothetical protein